MLTWSFILSVTVCVASFIPAVLDHNETLRKYKSCLTDERRKLGTKFLLLWLLPILAAISAVVSGFSSSDSDKKVGALEAKVKFRTITEEQKKNFKLLLKHAPKGKVLIISYANGGEEAFKYAEQIRQMFVSSEFESGDTVRVVFPVGPMIEGVRVDVKNETNLIAPYIQEALGKIGINALAYSNE